MRRLPGDSKNDSEETNDKKVHRHKDIYTFRWMFGCFIRDRETKFSVAGFARPSGKWKSENHTVPTVLKQKVSCRQEEQLSTWYSEYYPSYKPIVSFFSSHHGIDSKWRVHASDPP
jgi:hypothetical protein